MYDETPLSDKTFCSCKCLFSVFNLVYAITLTMVKKYITYTKKDHEITRRAFLTILKMKP